MSGPAPAGLGRRRGPWRPLGAVVAVDLRRQLRDRTTLFFVVALPFLIIFFVGSAFPADADDVPVAVVDEDGGAAAAELVAALDGSPTLVVEPYDDRRSVDRDLRLTDVAGAVVVPRGYGEALAAGEQVSVLLVVDLAESAAAVVRQAVGGVVAREGSRAGVEAFVAEQSGVGEEEAAAAVAAASGSTAPVEVRERAIADAGEEVGGSFAYIAPGQLTLFVFINSLAIGAALVEMRAFGVARRSLAAPLTTRTLLAGVLANRAVFALLQAAIIVGFGSLVFGVSWGDPAGALAVVVAFALVATGAGILAGTLARTAEQTTAVGIPVAIAMAMLGGCTWPIDFYPEPVQVVAHLTPHAWAMDAWRGLVLDGEGLADVLPEVAVLVGFAAVLLTAATARLRRTLT